MPHYFTLFIYGSFCVGEVWLSSYDRDCVVCKAYMFSFFMYENCLIFVY